MSSASGGQNHGENVGQNIRIVRQKMTDACITAGRDPASVRLLAVSKTFPAGDIRAAHAAGQIAFGESYAQEAVTKITELADLPLEWHYIGPLQSNKTRQIAESFAWVHAVDRLKIAERLSAQRPPDLPPLNLCVQVNISGEASKSGVEPAQALALARDIAALPRVKLRGLMAIPEPVEGLEAQRAPFRRLRELLGELQAAGLDCDTLSMGMSGDMQAAILEGATMVRIGTAIFGHRDYTTP